MAGRSLPATPSRIFRRRRRLRSRIAGAALLTLSFVVTVAGLEAVLFEAPAREQPPPPVAAASPTAAPPSDSAAPSTETFPALLLAAAPEALPRERADSAAVAPAPAPRAAARYWIEYGVFLGQGEGYARRLQQALAEHGITAAIVAAHGAGGRPLLRVRSAAIADDGEARAMAARAKRVLGIPSLLHRETGETAPSDATAVPRPAAGRGDAVSWVMSVFHESSSSRARRYSPPQPSPSRAEGRASG
jgi:hypothetical protein